MKPGVQIQGRTARIPGKVTEVMLVLDFNSVIFAITIAPLIVYTFIALAILSPWELYFALVGISYWFPYLNHGPDCPGKGEACVRKSPPGSK